MQRDLLGFSSGVDIGIDTLEQCLLQAKCISPVSLQVARSLGITELLRKREAHPSSAPECSSRKLGGKLEGKLGEASGQKRDREQGVVVSGAVVSICVDAGVMIWPCQSQFLRLSRLLLLSDKGVFSLQATGEGLATVKKARMAALSTDVPECPAAISGRQQKPGSSCAPATSKGKSHILWVAPCSVVLLAGTDVPRVITGW